MSIPTTEIEDPGPVAVGQGRGGIPAAVENPFPEDEPLAIEAPVEPNTNSNNNNN